MKYRVYFYTDVEADNEEAAKDLGDEDRYYDYLLFDRVEIMDSSPGG